MTEKLKQEIKSMRKNSVNDLFDKFIIIFDSNEKVRKENPNLKNEIRFHRNNLFDLIDNKGGTRKESKGGFNPNMMAGDTVKSK